MFARSHAWTRSTASSSPVDPAVIRAARSRSRCGRSAGSSRYDSRSPCDGRERHGGERRRGDPRHLRDDGVHHPLVQQDRRADRAVAIDAQATAREVHHVRTRGREEHVRLRLRDVEGLHDLVGERRWERADRDLGRAGGIDHEGVELRVRRGPDRAVVAIERLGPPQLRLIGAHPEHDLVGQAPAGPEVHRVAEPRVAEGPEVHDAVDVGLGQAGVRHVAVGRRRRPVAAG